MAGDSDENSSYIGSRSYPLRGGSPIDTVRSRSRPASPPPVMITRARDGGDADLPRVQESDSFRRRALDDPALEQCFIYLDRRKLSGRRRRRSNGSPKRDDEQDEEDIYNEFFGGTSNTYRPGYGAGRPDKWPYSSRIYEEPEPVSPEAEEERINGWRPSQKPQVKYYQISSSSAQRHLRERMAHGTLLRPGTHSYYDALEPESWSVYPRLIIARRGQRYLSPSFTYTKNLWDDYKLARVVRQRYGNLKLSQIGLLQKFIAYKTISYLYVLQIRWVQDSKNRNKGRFEIPQRISITDKDDAESRDAFMYKLRYPNKGDRTWCRTIDSLIEEGAIIDLEVSETFDAHKIYLALLLAILLSLAAALVYGFLMGNDFATGFSIASWMITAFGFFAAVVAAGEYFGMERPVSFQSAAKVESGKHVGVYQGWRGPERR